MRARSKASPIIATVPASRRPPTLTPVTCASAQGACLQGRGQRWYDCHGHPEEHGGARLALQASPYPISPSPHGAAIPPHPSHCPPAPCSCCHAGLHRGQAHAREVHRRSVCSGPRPALCAHLPPGVCKRRRAPIRSPPSAHRLTILLALYLPRCERRLPRPRSGWSRSPGSGS